MKKKTAGFLVVLICLSMISLVFLSVWKEKEVVKWIFPLLFVFVAIAPIIILTRSKFEK